MTRPVLLSQETPSHIQQSLWSDQDERTCSWSVRPRLRVRRACLSFSLQETFEIDSALKKKKLKLKVARSNHDKRKAHEESQKRQPLQRRKRSLKEEKLKCEYMVISSSSNPFSFSLLLYYFNKDIDLLTSAFKFFWCAYEISFSGLWYDCRINIGFKIFTLKFGFWWKIFHYNVVDTIIK